MTETPQQYTERILGYLEGRDPVALLAATPGRIAGLVKGVPRARLDRRPRPGAWSITEILAHLADTEIVQGFRLRHILGKNGTEIQSFDQDAWAAAFSYADHDPDLSLKAYLTDRERTVKLLGSLKPEQWDCYGMHAERGRETVTRVAQMTAGHDINHMRQIEAILEGSAG